MHTNHTNATQILIRDDEPKAGFFPRSALGRHNHANRVTIAHSGEEGTRVGDEGTRLAAQADEVIDQLASVINDAAQTLASTHQTEKAAQDSDNLAHSLT